MTRLFVVTLLALGLGQVAEAQVTLPVEPPILVSVFEAPSRVEGGQPQLTLALQSRREYPTLQYRLDAMTQVEGSDVTVTIARVINDSPYQSQMMGRASYTTPLRLAPGVYRLAIRNDSLVDRYSLRIGARTVEILGDSTPFTWPQRVAYRLPPTAVFVHCTPAGFSDAACDAFFSLVSTRLGLRADPDLSQPDRNPFLHARANGAVPDPLPQRVFTSATSEQYEQLLRLAGTFTDLFRHAQYKLSFVIWRANGLGSGCYDGVCTQFSS